MMADAVRGTKSDPNHRGGARPRAGCTQRPSSATSPHPAAPPHPATPPAGTRLNSPAALTAQHRAILILPKVDDRLGHTARLAPHRRRSSLTNTRPAPGLASLGPTFAPIHARVAKLSPGPPKPGTRPDQPAPTLLRATFHHSLLTVPPLS